MCADITISISEAATQTGISARTIRAWCQQWPGLGHRVGHDWRVDLDLLRDMALYRSDSGRLTMSPHQQAIPRKAYPRSTCDPVLLCQPQPGTYLTVTEASDFLGVERATIRRWCSLVPALGIRLLTERGPWLIDPTGALIVGMIRHRNNGRHAAGALVRGAKGSLQAKRDAYLRAILEEVRRGSDDDMLTFVASREFVPDCIAKFADKLRRAKERKRRTPPAAAAQPGEVHRGNR